MNDKVKLLLLLVFLGGCSSQFKFEKRFIDHFPKDNYDNDLYYERSMSLSSEFKQYGALRKDAYRYEGHIKEHVDSLMENVIEVVNYDDTCNIILPLRYYKNIDIGKPIVSACQEGTVVLPSFRKAKEFLSLDLSDYIFCVLENERGKFLKADDLFDKSIMPSSWTNGYTKGFALSKKQKIVIFWIDIW